MQKPKYKYLSIVIVTILTLLSSHHATGQNYLRASQSNSVATHQNTSPLRVGYIDFPPLYETLDDKAQGVLVDISGEVFNTLNLDYKEIPMPTKRLFSSLKSGLVQIWCGIRIDELQPQIWTGTIALHHLTLNLYSLSGDIEIASVTELRDQGVILLMGYNYGGWGEYIRNKQNNVNYIEVKSHADALRLFNTGRFQYLLNYQAPMNAALESSPLSNLSFHTIDRLDIVFNVSKKVPQGKQLLIAMEQTLASLIAQEKVKIQ